jgi:sporulation protein YlmC with PRC-barrel domain
MKTQWGRMALTAIISLSLIGGVAVANENQSQYPTTDQMRFQPKLEKANELIGAKVINHEGERLGTVEDIVLTPQRDAISYVAISHGGFLGFGGKLHAVPWSAFEVRPQENALVLPVDEEYLNTAKAFDKGNWPIEADKSWLDATRGRHAQYGEQARGEADESMMAEPRPEGTPAPQAYGRTEPTYTDDEAIRSPAGADIQHRRLTQLIGMTIKNPEGADLGELENIMIDLQQGKVAYGILSVSRGFLGMDKKLAAVPWSSLTIDEQRGTAMLNADRATLQAIAFDEDNYPNFEDVQYSRDLHQRFNARPYWEALGFVPGEQPGRGERAMMSPWNPESEYNKLFNSNEVKTLHGTIESVGVFTPDGTPVSGVRLRIRTDDGQLVTVHTGPRSYLERNNIAFYHGDEITVTGAPAKVGWRDVILASQIKKGDQTLDLRSKDGKPLWNVEELRGYSQSYNK